MGCIGVALTLAPDVAQAASTGATAQAVGNADAEVVAPLAVSALRDLDFGVVMGPVTGDGLVAVAAGAPGALYGGGAAAVCLAGNCVSPHPARFEVRGEPGRGYVVVVPSVLDVTAEGGTAHLRITDLGVRTDGHERQGAAGQLDAAGQDKFEVGGTLHIPAGTPSARFRVSVPLVVNYG